MEKASQVDPDFDLEAWQEQHDKCEGFESAHWDGRKLVLLGDGDHLRVVTL